MYKELIKKMTLEEKASLMVGVGNLSTGKVERLNIKENIMADGPHGVRTTDRTGNCTLMPNECALASSWDKNLAYKMGLALADECIENDKDMLLGPGVNIKRHPLCGRNFEYISEDPYLSGEMVSEYINGLQSKGVAASLKHFVANNQEEFRIVTSVEIDERTLREIYLKPYEIAVKKAKPVSIMCSYNKLNGVPVSENKFVFDILKKEWGFEGLIVSDWGCVRDNMRSYNSGLDLKMPGSEGTAEDIVELVKAGKLSEERVNDAVERILKFMLLKKTPKEEINYDRDVQHKITRDIEKECITLLKNENDILPLSAEKYKKITVIGEYAVNPLVSGQGAARVHCDKSYIDSPVEELKKLLPDVEIKYLELYKKCELFKQGLWGSALTDFNEYLKDSDLVIFFSGSMESEDTEQFDRVSARINPNHEYVMKKAFEAGKKVVTILQSGGVLLLDNVNMYSKAIVQMWLGGEGAGGAIADVLCGKVNPSGKLAETFPKKLRTDMDYPGNSLFVEYNEKLDVGYRYYDKHTEEILYPFGYGLSYTSFEYSDLKVENDEETIKLSFNLKNIGVRDGKEIVQIYGGDPVSTVKKSVKELIAFEKVELKAGETKKVEIQIPVKNLAYYNTMIKDWVVENGEYIIYVAASSQDIRLKQSIVHNGEMPYTLKGNEQTMMA